MQDTNPPAVIMADENLPKQTWSTRKASRRLWTCPSHHAIASYVDGTLGGEQKCRVELHLSKCSYCRQIVADTVKAQREVELTPPPSTLFNKAVQTLPSEAVSRAWFLVPAGVVAIVVAIAAATIFLRHPEQAVIPPPHPVPAPVIAKFTAAPNAKSSVPDVVRSLPTSNPPLRITFPRAGSVVKNERLQIRWIGMPDAGSYEVSVLASDGDLVWKGETHEPVLAMPSSVSLKNGSYFVSVTSYLPNGRTVKAGPISFVVKR